jgi:hypothetical protein
VRTAVFSVWEPSVASGHQACSPRIDRHLQRQLVRIDADNQPKALSWLRIEIAVEATGR